MTALDTVFARFHDRFGEAPKIVTRAPGRVNLIGEHTDAHEGFVFPAAIDRYVYLAASPAEGSDLSSEDIDHPSWKAYPEGVQWALEERGLHVPPLRAVVSGDVPIGSGISSSAALELAFAVAWNEIGSLRLSALDLAVVGQRAENGYVGVNCGLMDQMASACGKAGHAVFFDTLTKETVYAPLPEDVCIVIADTGRSRELTGSAYNDRRADCELAARTMGVRALRHATVGELEDAADLMPDSAFRRARHVITENQRCLSFARALEANDRPKIGSLMQASHASLRDDYEASCPELDAMAEACWASPGCVGARMTGAGFGGACVALVDRAQLDHFLKEAEARYQGKMGHLHSKFLVCKAADGASRIA